MNDFLQDLWHDLREKRLVPVAAAMLVAIVAIPVLLTESAAEPPSATPLASTDVDESRTLALDTETANASGKGSELDVFAPDDPFAPPAAVTRVKGTATAASADGQTAGADDKGAGSGGSQGGSGGGGGSQPVEPTPVPPKTSKYEYVVDVTFWSGDGRKSRSLRKLDMLPNADNPVLIFMGATQDGGNAVFLVDSTLETAGEGTCQPSGENCVYVQIGPGAEHVFTSEDGQSYRLRVDEIRRVKVRASSSTSDGPSAHTSTGDGTGFSLPSLVDLVVETTAGSTVAGTPSSNPTTGR